MAMEAIAPAVVPNERRYAIAKRLDATEMQQFGLASTWLSCQLTAPGSLFGDDFPGAVLLRAANYVAVEDLLGADTEELTYYAGLSTSLAQAAIDAAEAYMTSTGYTGRDGGYNDCASEELIFEQTFAEGDTLGAAVEVGDRGTARLVLDVLAVSGTNPTFDGQVMTSKDGALNWRHVGSFDQATGAARAMGSVTAAGTTPPTLTLTGNPNFDMVLAIECTTAGARGTWKFRYSTDGEQTWVTGVTSAATVALNNSATGVASGVTLNIAAGNAAVDNTWDASYGLQMGAVTATGTTPPTVTLTGLANRPINFDMRCTTLGARGVAVVKTSIDGGHTWKYSITTAATFALVDPSDSNAATGITVNYANAAAATDNKWVAIHAGYQAKVFSGLDRFARVIGTVGGTSTPTATVNVTGEGV